MRSLMFIFLIFSRMPPIKIAIIGPKESGKTKITNIITGNYVPENTTYDPTIGVRIVPHIHEQDVRYSSSLTSSYAMRELHVPLIFSICVPLFTALAHRAR